MQHLIFRFFDIAPQVRGSMARLTAGSSEPSPELPVADGLSEETSFLERFEAEQKARQKAHNDRAALHRKALAQGQRPA